MSTLTLSWILVQKQFFFIKKTRTQADYAIIYNTLQKDPSNSEIEAVEHVYRVLRNAEPPDEETARGIIDKLFFSDKRYDLGEVGRYRINKKLRSNIDMELKSCPNKILLKL